MDTTLRTKYMNDDALRTLGTQIETLLGETSLGIKCTLKNNRLVVLGEHAADIPLDSAIILDRLEQNIQALQLQFTQQVRLYIRQVGQHQPYAYRQFVLAPPPPPLLRKQLDQQLAQPPSTGEQADEATAHSVETSHSVPLDDLTSPLSSPVFIPPELPKPPSAIDEQPWIVGDAELDVLVNQLTALDPLENWDITSQDAQNVEPKGEENHELTPQSSEIDEVQQAGNGQDIRLDANDVQPPVEPMDKPEAFSSSVVSEFKHEAIAAPSLAPSIAASTDSNQQNGIDNESDSDADTRVETTHPDTSLAPKNSEWLDNGLIPNATELVLCHATDHDADLGDDVGLGGEADLVLAPEKHSEQDNHIVPEHSALSPSAPKALMTEQPKSLQESQPPLTTTIAEHSGSTLAEPESSEASSLVVAESEEMAQPRFHSFTYETSQRLKELSQSLLHPRPKTSIAKTDPQQPPATAHLENHGYRRMAIATMGLASLGFATGIYGATRPCVLGACTALQDAEHLGNKSQRLMEQAQTWTDIEATIPSLNQALDILEPIPLWSSHSVIAQQQMETYTVYLGQIHQLLDVEQAINHATQLDHQTVYSFEDLQTVRSLWKSAIDDLDLLPIDSPLHSFAQTHLVEYHPQLTQVDQKLQKEETAQATLETAKEAAQLAQARQGVAQSLENWQFARVTWLVALNRLKQVSTETLASKEAERLMDFYQTSLDEVNVHVNREQIADNSLKKAEQHAQLATAAERRHDWQRAIADWNHAIQYTQEIGSNSTYYLKAEGLLNQYQDAASQVKEKLNAKTLIEGELKQSCIGELQLCHIVSIDQSIKLELDESYMDAISTARGNGNYNLQAVVTDHQLMVRQSLDRIANNFDLPIEVYNPDGGLLERHLPKPH